MPRSHVRRPISKKWRATVFTNRREGLPSPSPPPLRRTSNRPHLKRGEKRGRGSRTSQGEDVAFAAPLKEDMEQMQEQLALILQKLESISEENKQLKERS